MRKVASSVSDRHSFGIASSGGTYTWLGSSALTAHRVKYIACWMRKRQGRNGITSVLGMQVVELQVVQHEVSSIYRPVQVYPIHVDALASG